MNENIEVKVYNATQSDGNLLVGEGMVSINNLGTQG